jgi:hypothetical protein
MDVGVQIASAERRLQALRQQQANFVAKFARLGSAEQKHFCCFNVDCQRDASPTILLTIRNTGSGFRKIVHAGGKIACAAGTTPRNRAIATFRYPRCPAISRTEPRPTGICATSRRTLQQAMVREHARYGLGRSPLGFRRPSRFSR